MITGPSVGTFPSAESSVPIDGRNPVGNQHIPSIKAKRRTIRRRLIRHALRKRLRRAGVRAIQHIERQPYPRAGALHLRRATASSQFIMAAGDQRRRRRRQQGNFASAGRRVDVEPFRLDGEGLLNLQRIGRVDEGQVEFLDYGSHDEAGELD